MGESLGKNPGYIKLRKIRAAQNISKTVSLEIKQVFDTQMHVLIGPSKVTPSLNQAK